MTPILSHTYGLESKSIAKYIYIYIYMKNDIIGGGGSSACADPQNPRIRKPSKLVIENIDLSIISSIFVSGVWGSTL